MYAALASVGRRGVCCPGLLRLLRPYTTYNPQLTFTGHPLVRHPLHLSDPATSSALLTSPTALFLPFNVPTLDPLTEPRPNKDGTVPTRGPRQLSWVTPDTFGSKPISNAVLLGADRLTGGPRFAIPTDQNGPLATEIVGQVNGRRFLPLRTIAPSLSQADTALSAHGRALLQWHSTSAHCPLCGSTTNMVDAGRKRVCVNTSCQTHSTNHPHSHPRVDPTAIVLVLHPDREHCLLGRSPHFPPGFYSCLAGFVDMAESVEEAARREVYEEAGVTVGPVQYLFSQPWPFPSTLMLAMAAVATTDTIKIDPQELAHADWFSREAVAMALNAPPNQKAELMVPPPLAVAHHLLRAWVKGDQRITALGT